MIKNNIGILSYASSLPDQKISIKEIAKGRGKNPSVADSLGVYYKTVPEIDDDAITLATDAGLEALNRFKGNKKEISTLFIGSESHPYAVKPSGTVVKEALGLSDYLSMADLQFACKAGSQSLQIACAYALSGLGKFAMAIGSDTAQAKPEDALEYTAAAGAAAFIVGKENEKNKILARLLATKSVATDTPDFWRKPKQSYPQHAGRFTGKPAYFKHIILATEALMKENKIKVSDIDHVVFHTPNAKFPKAVAKILGFSKKQLQLGLLVPEIGNTYAAASLIALTAVLDKAKTGEKILVTSYGSGAGSDAFLFEVTENLEKFRKNWQNFLEDQIEKMKEMSFVDYQNLFAKNQH
jgi:hydroxymethylglutaryl-CoA synthase